MLTSTSGRVQLETFALDMIVSAKRQAFAPAKVQDWTYRAARLRLRRAGRTRLPAHTAVAELDAHANRVVRCACGWRGNGLGWLEHLDHIVRAAIGAR